MSAAKKSHEDHVSEFFVSYENVFFFVSDSSLVTRHSSLDIRRAGCVSYFLSLTSLTSLVTRHSISRGIAVYFVLFVIRVIRHSSFKIKGEIKSFFYKFVIRVTRHSSFQFFEEKSGENLTSRHLRHSSLVIQNQGSNQEVFRCVLASL